ncbi:ParA family protein [Providencia stuartii]|uniref:ParA family protein n=1 Tax=Providencia stuartii TaxID=588 RepID=UPI001B7A4BB7|nr:ParA family protein [Providencia stuartii]MBQ0693485.1 ParA family protein [Providencia stuartii]
MNVVIAQHKGGVGKTTLATHISGILSERDLDKCLLVDCDSQGDSFRFYTGRSPNKEMEIVTGNSNVDVLWNPSRNGLSTKASYSEYDHVIVDIDTRIQNALQVIMEISPDVIIIPVDSQYLSLRHLEEVLSLISKIEGRFSYPALVKVVQMGSNYDIDRAIDKFQCIPDNLYTNYSLPYLRDEFDNAMRMCNFIWNIYEEHCSIKEILEEIVSDD